MPLYEYQCKKCEKMFEILLSFRELDDPVKCPDCGSEETDRLLSTFSASVGDSTRNSSCSPGST
jgi:putative FmdB family regulatory protein